MKRLLTLAALSALASCATLEHGTVAETYPNQLVRIYLGSDDGLARGSRVAFFEEDCLDEMIGGYPRHIDVCRRRAEGYGTVSQILGPAQALVIADPGADVRGNVLVLSTGERTQALDAHPEGVAPSH